MTDPFERLEQQLREAVRGQAPVPARRWRPVRGLTVAVVAALTVSGGALAATRLIGGGQSAETQGRKIAVQAAQETARLAACSPVDRDAEPDFIDGTPLPEITKALPLVAAPTDRLDDLSRLAPFPTDRVLRSSVHQRRYPGSLVVTVFVSAGGFLGAQDPGACEAARRTRVEELLDGRSPAVRRWALRRLAQFNDVAPGAQALWLFTRSPRKGERPRGIGGGAGIPVRPGRPIRRGLSSGATSPQGTVYTGFAAPDVAAVRVLPTKRVEPFRRPVRDGLWALRVPNRTGPARLQELDADGKVLRTIKLR